MLLSDWVQEFLIKNRNVLEAAVVAVLALLGFVLRPV